LKNKYNYITSTIKASNILKQIVKDKKFFRKNFVSITLSILLEIYVRTLGWIDFHLGRKHYIWDTADSTKKI
jgi:hypothetical protein